MKLKSIKGLLPEKMTLADLTTGHRAFEDYKTDRNIKLIILDVLDRARREIGEKELCVDVEKVIKIIKEHNAYTIVPPIPELPQKVLAQAIAKADIIKVKALKEV